LDGRMGRHRNCSSVGFDPERFLGLAARSRREHDRSRFGRFCCQRSAKALFVILF
jgi:hypothetical protein